MVHSPLHCPIPCQLRCQFVLCVTPCLTLCMFIVKVQGNKMGGNTLNGFNGPGKCSAIVTFDIPFDPKTVSVISRLRDKDLTSRSYSRWRPSNKHLHADQFSSTTLRLKFYKNYSTTRTVGKKTLEEGLILRMKRLTTVSINHLSPTW